MEMQKVSEIRATSSESALVVSWGDLDLGLVLELLIFCMLFDIRLSHSKLFASSSVRAS
jgi:hypothetical protein